MKRMLVATVVCIVLSPAALVAQTTHPATRATTRAAATHPIVYPQPADIPAMKPGKNGNPNTAFVTKHNKFLERAKQGDVDLLFLGDSITELWSSKGADVWKQHYADKYGERVANFGISGDRTQHVLWRELHGELDGIKPKVIVIMIGTNNVNDDPADKIAAAVTKIVQIAREKAGAKILLLGVFPRGEKPDDATTAKQREKLRAVNETISKLDDGTNVRYLDLWDKFLEPDQTLSKDIMPDSLHPNEAGYKIWAEGMDPLLNEMMGK